jgi:RimJ/RimL family protein N-acetyltransferase
MDMSDQSATNWREHLPTLNGRLSVLREPTMADVGPIFDLLSIADATRFGMDEPVSGIAVQQLIERLLREREAGLAFAHSILPGVGRPPVGLMYVRQLDPSFEVAEFECTLVPSARGSGMFLDAARLVGSFAFGTVGARRLESRILLRNGRGNTAFRKLGAVQEGILRRSIRINGEFADQVLWSLLKDDWGDQPASAAPYVH